MTHPVRYEIEAPGAPRDRLSVAFRPILAIPHLLIVGGPVVGVFGGWYRTGAFGVLAAAIALLDWFAVLFTGRTIADLQGYKRAYLRWRARALAYVAMLRDEYPPFGEATYPATLHLPEEPVPRNRLSVAARPILLIPHLIVLALLLIAWVVAAVVSWFVIVITGRLPSELWSFGRDVIAYGLRVEAYALLVHDAYPPFVLSEDALRESPARVRYQPPEESRA